MRTIVFHIFHGLFVLLLMVSCFSRQKSQDTSHGDEPDQLVSEVRENLTENILPLWSGIMVDTNSGFYGRLDAENHLYKEDDRGGIQNARILWTFSAAFDVLHDSSCLIYATHARDYIFRHFLDTVHGGAYMSVNSKGEALDTRKQVYTQAFFIYGLSEYYMATGDRQSLEKAIGIFNLVEKYSFDAVHNGYFELYSRDWKRISAEVFGGESENDAKGMNTHIHLLEAYTNLYRAWPDEQVAERLRNLIRLFCDKFIHKDNHHLIIYFDEEWVPTKTFFSYGHDIELSWLLVEAARLLGDPDLLQEVSKISIQMTDAACEGLQPDGSLMYEKDPATGHVNSMRQYWAQAEAMVGLINAFELTGNGLYLENALNCWNYIKGHLIDYEKGGWFFYATDPGLKGDKAGFWKGPYHHSRMCMEVIRRCEK